MVWYWSREARKAQVQPSLSPQCWSARTSVKRTILWSICSNYYRCSFMPGVVVTTAELPQYNCHHNNLAPSNVSHWSTTRAQENGLKFPWVETQAAYTLWVPGLVHCDALWPSSLSGLEERSWAQGLWLGMEALVKQGAARRAWLAMSAVSCHKLPRVSKNIASVRLAACKFELMGNREVRFVELQKIYENLQHFAPETSSSCIIRGGSSRSMRSSISTPSGTADMFCSLPSGYLT